MNIRDALEFGVSRLTETGVSSASTDARWLLAHVLSVSPSELIVSGERVLKSNEIDSFEVAIARRSEFQPVAQITEKREFWGRVFEVTQDTLDPRPETETLIALALENSSPQRILDLGTGTGCILLTLLAEFPNATGVGTDVSESALKVAARNATALALSKRVELETSDWWNNVDGTFDLIVSNPPYISDDEMNDLSRDVKDWEPHIALTPGGDGLEPYRIIAAGLHRFLSRDGTALFEFGSTQAKDIVAIFMAQNWLNTRVERDMNGQDRILVVTN